eukprot:TRINITY_DN71465_c0_g1_i1.p1 TRINITY_DN71465_c0_g1~~TRINITY_DN71465_c0_g1_i1.p1  ORF type:complete len:260 (-),score=34.77 TRINITY_DN71465_c0_g1_i1:238-960(-)
MSARGISILFELRQAETSPGEFISVVGSLPELGNWDAYTSAMPLQTGRACYPLWSMNGPLPIILNAEECPETPSGSTSSDDIDCWENAARRPPAIESATETLRFEYKYIKDRRHCGGHGQSIQWEDGISNRVVSIPAEPGSIWVLSDAKFNDAHEQPRLKRTTLLEILEGGYVLDMRVAPEQLLPRQRELSPEWTGSERTAQDENLSQRSSSLPSLRTHYTGHTNSTVLHLAMLVNQGKS